MDENSDDSKEYKVKAEVAKNKAQKYLVESRELKHKALKVNDDESNEKSALIKTYNK